MDQKQTAYLIQDSFLIFVALDKLKLRWPQPSNSSVLAKHVHNGSTSKQSSTYRQITRQAGLVCVMNRSYCFGFRLGRTSEEFGPLGCLLRDRCVLFAFLLGFGYTSTSRRKQSPIVLCQLKTMCRFHQAKVPPLPSGYLKLVFNCYESHQQSSLGYLKGILFMDHTQ